MRKVQHRPQRPAMRAPVHQPVHVAVHTEPASRLTRKRFDAAGSFDIDPSVIPPGMDWNWKTETVMGEEQTRRMHQYRMNHWEEVDAAQVPGFMPSGYSGPVRVDGQVLMQRPKYLSDEAQNEARVETMRQISSQVQQSAVEGEGEGPRSRPRLQREWNAVE